MANFMFFESFRTAAQRLPKDERLKLYDAIIDYGVSGIEPNLPEYLAAIFDVVKASLDTSRQAFENGKKGGRPKKDGKNPPKNPPFENLETPLKSTGQDRTGLDCKSVAADASAAKAASAAASRETVDEWSRIPKLG